MAESRKRRAQEGRQPADVERQKKNSTGAPAAVPAGEETEGATKALETPAMPPEMAKDEKPQEQG
jgi:hypothetical protein